MLNCQAESARFEPCLRADVLFAFLSGADLTIEAQFGDWTRQPLSDTSPEIITIARTGSARVSAATAWP